MVETLLIVDLIRCIHSAISENAAIEQLRIHERRLSHLGVRDKPLLRIGSSSNSIAILSKKGRWLRHETLFFFYHLFLDLNCDTFRHLLV